MSITLSFSFLKTIESLTIAQIRIQVSEFNVEWRFIKSVIIGQFQT